MTEDNPGNPIGAACVFLIALAVTIGVVMGAIEFFEWVFAM